MTKKLNAEYLHELCAMFYTDIQVGFGNDENQPVGFLLKPDGSVMALPFDFDNDAAKAKSINIARMIYGQENCIGFCFISEAWMSNNSDMKRPSEDPERKEVFIIHAVHNGPNGIDELSLIKEIKTGEIIQRFHNEAGMVMNIRLDKEELLTFGLPLEDVMPASGIPVKVNMIETNISKLKEIHDKQNENDSGAKPGMH